MDEASPGERVALVAFDQSAEVLSPPGPGSAARAALETVHAGFASTRYGAVFTRAAEIAGADSARLILITDLQRAGWEGEQRGVLPDTIALEIRDAGPPPANLSVDAVRIAGDQVVASIHNSGRETRTGRVRVEQDERTAASADYTARPDGTTDVAIRYKAPVPDPSPSLWTTNEDLQQTTPGTWCSIPRCTVTSCWLRRGRGIPAFTSPVCSGRHAIAG